MSEYLLLCLKPARLVFFPKSTSLHHWTAAELNLFVSTWVRQQEFNLVASVPWIFRSFCRDLFSIRTFPRQPLKCGVHVLSFPNPNRRCAAWRCLKKYATWKPTTSFWQCQRVSSKTRPWNLCNESWKSLNPSLHSVVLSDFLWCIIAFSWKSCCHALFVHKIKPFHFLSLTGFHIQDSPLRKPFTWVLGRSSSHWGDCCCTLLRYLWPLPLLQTQFDCFSAFLFEWTLYASLSYTWMYPEMNYTSKSSTFNGNSKKKEVQLLRFLRKSSDSLSELHIA